MRIFLDAMGGDNAPQAPVAGALEALRRFPRLEIVLAGDPAAIEPLLKDGEDVRSRLTVLDAPEVITNHESPVMGVRRKTKSATVIGMLQLRDKEVDGFVSAGSTGDQALQDMGKLLYRVAMDYQAMAVRFGGDEFILLRTVAKLEEMLQVGEALRKAVNNFNAKKHRPYALTFSMGTTVFQGERQSLDDFLRNMDAAMYQSKRDRSHAEVLAGMEHGNACSYGCNGDF